LLLITSKQEEEPQRPEQMQLQDLEQVLLRDLELVLLRDLELGLQQRPEQVQLQRLGPLGRLHHLQQGQSPSHCQQEL